MLNLDTHILLKALNGTIDLREQNIMAEHPEWGISAIGLWEITKFRQLGRIKYGLEHQPLLAVLNRIYIWPISREVCAQIPLLDFQADPADEIITATSIAYQVPLLTRDKRIRNSKLLTCL